MSTTPHAPDPSPARRHRRWWWVVVVAVALVVAAVVVAADVEHRVWEHTQARYAAAVTVQEEAAAGSRADAEAAYAAGHDDVVAAIDEGRPVLTQSRGQVEHPKVRRTLAAALEDAEALRDAPVTYPTTTSTVEAVTRPNPFRPETLPAVEAEVVEDSDPTRAALDAAAADVAEATDAVVQARREWAYDALEPAVQDARDALDALEGEKVGAGLRDTLGEAAAQGTAVLDAGPDEVDGDAAVELRDTLEDTTRAVWTDRIDRIVSARRAAAKADGVDCTVDRCVALTFDDGPVADTERLLEILDRKDAPATFFLVGSNVERNPGIARDILDAGHLVANHSWNHPLLTTLDDADVREELRSTTDAIVDATGFRPYLVRPPYGDVDDRVRGIATSAGMDVVLWSLDSDDWRTRDPKRVREDVMDRVTDGSNILMHDIHPSTVDAVGPLIRALRKEGYTLVPVDLLAD
ncbi:peptidoglycan/xylan/chitin deacetylase (PgdA/CDA1 family) [Isoptericola jiangsuensis]|uniref:Peptidoglycan/xylan/chitin deacetylase (PgdA/CDA1 family) n=1 Tax=Isoptericola jiangsuensis TaxID=548579 RepID=A0A2A9ETD1_9MICO|nr:polysaccharide deacetylase family protein [Isoptericola jiangsuensis]PFG41522.1 peptidoglycan/xylan/chitin deacetylase (PgdA/CDA1 family) [Isoptericola jiangsuensis]